MTWKGLVGIVKTFKFINTFKLKMSHDVVVELSIYQYSSLLYEILFDQDISTSSEDGIDAMNLCFYLSLFVTKPNQSICMKAQKKHNKIIEQFMEPNIAKIITSFIIDESNYLRWQLYEKEHSVQYQQQVHLSMDNHIIDFSNANRDYLNVRTQLLSKEITRIYYINIYCLGKGDELWLGIMNKNSFTAKENARCHKNGLFYYGGREYTIKRYGGSIMDECKGWSLRDDDCNHGGIQGGGKVIKHPIESYQSGDWINFEIDLVHKTVIFYKNGKEQYITTSQWFPGDDVCFMVELDTSKDKFFIEQASEI